MNIAFTAQEYFGVAAPTHGERLDGFHADGMSRCCVYSKTTLLYVLRLRQRSARLIAGSGYGLPQRFENLRFQCLKRSSI